MTSIFTVRFILLAPLCAILCLPGAMAATQPAAGPTVHDIVEFTRIVQPQGQNDDALNEQVSPDGTQAFIVTRKADVASDRNRYEIQLLDLRPESLAVQRLPAPVTLFSAAVSHDNDEAVPGIQDVRWHDDRTLAFLARLDGESFQVYRLDVPKRELVQLTHEKNVIVSYAASQDLRRVVYAVQVPNPPSPDGAHDIVVGARSFWSVKFGQHDLRSQDRLYRYFVADVASRRPPRALGEAFSRSGALPLVSIAPDGRWALVHRHEPERLADWERDYPMVAELSKKYARSHQVDPLGYFSKPITYVPRLTEAWRLDDGKEQTVVDAPDDALPSQYQLRSDRMWQGTGRSVVLAGTYLPPTPNGETSKASHIIEYWPDTARWVDIATLATHLEQARAIRGGFVAIDGTRRREFRRQADGGWRESTGDADPQTRSGPAWTLRIVQNLNQPPDVYATSPSGERTRLTRLNPQFDAATWGDMQPYTWLDGAGRRWRGGLMAGRDMDIHKRYPLLIQTYGFSPDRFYLDGPNTFDGYTSAFAGRAFLREGILVLAMPLGADSAPAQSARQGQLAFHDGVRSAIDALVKEGRVDPSRVGIIGFSAYGQRVLNLLAFGDAPIRASTIADGDANTMFSLAVTYASADTMWGRKEAANEGLPFGDGLAAWVRNDPSLHTDCIRAALRIETYGPWVLNNWDIYALLRRQYKPAEMVVIPDGTHSLSTPGDRMASLQGNVDWYAFWLADRTRRTPLLAAETTNSLATQYAHWQQMAKLKAVDDARPSCVR